MSLDKEKQWVLQQRTDIARLVVPLLFDPKMLKYIFEVLDRPSCRAGVGEPG
jgi:hypothetical protein